MTPFAVTEGYIKAPHLDLLEKVRKSVEKMPDGLNCHQVCCRLAEQFLNLEWVKGRFNHWDHSWLSISGTRLVIDAYPWACGSGPILVDCQTGSPWATLYREGQNEDPKLAEKVPDASGIQVQGGLWAPLPQDDLWNREQSPDHSEGGNL